VRLTPRAALLFGLILLLIPPCETRATYQFTNVADNTGSFSVLNRADINNSGAVAFNASLDNGGGGIYIRPRGGLISTVVDTSQGPLNSFGAPVINDGGAIAFRGSSNFGLVRGIYTANGGSIGTIVTNATAPFIGNHFFSGPGSISSAGTVAFHAAQLSVGGSGIFTGSGGGVTTIADESGMFGRFAPSVNRGIAPSINAGGTTVFFAELDGGAVQGLYASNGGAITPLLDNSGPFYSFQSRPQINDSGVIAFLADLDGVTGEYVFTRAADGTITQISSTNLTVHALDEPVLNNLGEVAFYGRASSVPGIFTGADPANDVVIRHGDSLFGSTLSFTYVLGINDDGEILFHYDLAKGVTGIAVATVPEPKSGVLLLVSVVLLLGKIRGKRTS
jgi:hypothetical protein